MWFSKPKEPADFPRFTWSESNQNTLYSLFWQNPEGYRLLFLSVSITAAMERLDGETGESSLVLNGEASPHSELQRVPVLFKFIDPSLDSPESSRLRGMSSRSRGRVFLRVRSPEHGPDAFEVVQIVTPAESRALKEALRHHSVAYPAGLELHLSLTGTRESGFWIEIFGHSFLSTLFRLHPEDSATWKRR